MGVLLRELTGTLVSAGFLGGVGYLIYSRLKADAAAILPTPAKVAEGVKGILVGSPGAIRSIVKGESSATYITDAQQRANAAANLAQKKALTQGAA